MCKPLVLMDGWFLPFWEMLCLAGPRYTRKHHSNLVKWIELIDRGAFEVLWWLRWTWAWCPVGSIRISAHLSESICWAFAADALCLTAGKHWSLWQEPWGSARWCLEGLWESLVLAYIDRIENLIFVSLFCFYFGSFVTGFLCVIALFVLELTVETKLAS